MEEDNKEEFSFPTLFLVTGSGFLAFAFTLKILDGVNIKFFLGFGLMTFIAGLITGAGLFLIKKTEKRKTK